MTFDLNDKAARPQPELVLKGGLVNPDEHIVPQCVAKGGVARQYCQRCHATVGERCSG